MVEGEPGDGCDSCAVVVPAHDEERLIGDTLDSLTAAAGHADVAMRLIVVADSCADRTAAIAFRHGAEVVTLRALNVGAARRAGFSRALGHDRGASTAAGSGFADDVSRRTRSRGLPDWCATTDADTVVPLDWFSRQMAHRRRGADVVSGTIGLRVDDDPRGGHSTWRDGYEQRLGRATHTHVHGANLSFTTEAYRRLGGFRPLASEEDVDFVRRAERAGLSVVWALDVRVETSARLVGRAPAGVAADLRAALEATP